MPTGTFLATLASHESGCTTPVLFTRQMWQLCLGVYQNPTLRLQSLLGVLQYECSNMNAATQQALLGIVAGYAAKVNKKTLFPIKKLEIEF